MVSMVTATMMRQSMCLPVSTRLGTRVSAGERKYQVIISDVAHNDYHITVPKFVLESCKKLLGALSSSSLKRL